LIVERRPLNSFPLGQGWVDVSCVTGGPTAVRLPSTSMKLEDFEMAVIELAHTGVRITVANVVVRLKLPPTQVEAWLDELATKGRLDVEVDDREGFVFYRVRGLSTASRNEASRALAPYGERAMREAAASVLDDRFRSSALPPEKRKRLLFGFLLGLFLPGLGLLYAAPWATAIVATLAAVVLLVLAKLPLVGGLIGAATAIASAVAGLLYTAEYNKRGKRSPVFEKRLPGLPKSR
jgi:hypothetical protein